MKSILSRRTFLKAASLASASIPASTYAAGNQLQEGLHIVGPKEGFSPHIGTLLSMMTWMREVVLANVQGLTSQQLDYLHDSNANSIGAMLLHLAATERNYQFSTFDWKHRSQGEKVNWDAATELGDPGRKSIKGHDLKYYVNVLNETREQTIGEFKQRDDEWLMKIDPHGFQNMPTNNYCKWFHVCEHESNHNGQIKWLKSRLPGGKYSRD